MEEEEEDELELPDNDDGRPIRNLHTSCTGNIQEVEKAGLTSEPLVCLALRTDWGCV